MIIIAVFLIISYIIMCYGLSLLFNKASVSPVKAWIPIVNYVEWAKLIGRKPIYILWLLFPIVNLFIFVEMAMDLIQSFGKTDTKDAILNFLYAPGYFVYLGKQDDVQYIKPYYASKKAYLEKIKNAEKSNIDSYELKKLIKNNPYKKKSEREWIESIVFSVFVAAFIRMFLIEAYNIPTSSMEGSLLVGDYLFVSKVHYGLRIPLTVVQVPLLHNVIPFIGSKSYLEKPSLPYMRLPKISPVKRNDPVVFNWPVGDSVYIYKGRGFSVGQLMNMGQLDEIKRVSSLVTHPLDKTDFYVKRTIGMPGDSLSIINRQVYINGKAIENPENIQFKYELKENGIIINFNKLRDEGISLEDKIFQSNRTILVLNNRQKELLLEKYPGIELNHIEILSQPGNKNLFPNNPQYTQNWTMDNYGPIFIPKKGVQVTLNEENFSYYHRIINVYENNTLEHKNNTYYINGKEATTYTFKYDYYWMMGDNRHNSEDSRVWGYVPETHIVGKPLFIFFSTQEGNISNGVRWNRIFSGARKFQD